MSAASATHRKLRIEICWKKPHIVTFLVHAVLGFLICVYYHPLDSNCYSDGGLKLHILVRVTISRMKHHDQERVGKERVYLARTSTSLFITKGSQKPSQGCNLKGGAIAEALQRCCYWFAPHGLFSLLLYRTQDTSPGWPSSINH